MKILSINTYNPICLSNGENCGISAFAHKASCGRPKYLKTNKYQMKRNQHIPLPQHLCDPISKWPETFFNPYKFIVDVPSCSTVFNIQVANFQNQLENSSTGQWFLNFYGTLSGICFCKRLLIPELALTWFLAAIHVSVMRHWPFRFKWCDRNVG